MTRYRPRYRPPSFIDPDAPARPAFDDVFGIDEYKNRRGTHGSPELDADAAKLRAMGQDPGPTDAELDRSLARMDHVLGAGWQDEIEHTLQKKMMGGDPTKTGIFRSHRCWRCDDGAKPCVRGTPNLCDYSRARND